jgi:F-type H+-transporting ATPase subunit b
MLIDWFTVSAQVLNFLILVWLLKHFLYKPILHAIDAREQRIAKELADAEAKMDEAQKERDEFRHKNEKFDQQRDELLSEAKDEVKGERQRLLNEARQAADDLRAKRQDALKREQQNLNDEITRKTQNEVFAITRKTLSDLSGTTLEERMSEVFDLRLRNLDDKAKESLATILKTSSDPAILRSAFELPSEQRALIQHALNETFSAEIQVRFETAPEVISGIELTANGQKLAWSIADYLEALEKSVGELLKEQSNPKNKPEVIIQMKPEIQAERKAKSETKPAVPEESK